MGSVATLKDVVEGPRPPCDVTTNAEAVENNAAGKMNFMMIKGVSKWMHALLLVLLTVKRRSANVRFLSSSMHIIVDGGEDLVNDLFD